MVLGQRIWPRGIRQVAFGAALLTAVLLGVPLPAAITITAPNITLPYSASPQVGTFEVFVASTASPQPQVSAFGVDLQLPSFSGITFTAPSSPTTNTTPTTHPYLFSGQAPTERVTNAGRTVLGTDFAQSSLPTLSNGAGLLLVTYSIPAGANGVFPLTFVDYSTSNPFGTGLFDGSNNQISTTDGNGSIVIQAPTAYWHGGTDGLWTTDNQQTGVTNWTIDAAGTTDTHIAPGSSTDVFFVGSGAANLSTTLGSNFSIKGLTFTATATSPVSISGNTLTLGTDALTVQAGSAAHTINSAVTITGSQTWHIANAPANALTITGAITLPASATLTKADGGTLRVTAAPSLGNSSSLAVSGGVLRFSVNSGTPTIGTGVTATVSPGATLELAGSVSALSSTTGANLRASVANDSNAGGLLVTGTNQQVGAISGAGTTTIAAGGSLTANSIIQSAIVIAGAQGSPALLTIAASDNSGHSLAESMTGFIQPGGGAALIGLDGIDSIAGSAPAPTLPNGDLSAGQVPEPSTLASLGAALILGTLFQLRRRLNCTR